jgi:hypothetical protein
MQIMVTSAPGDWEAVPAIMAIAYAPLADTQAAVKSGAHVLIATPGRITPTRRSRGSELPVFYAQVIQSSRYREFPPGASVGSLVTLFLSARYGSPQLSGPARRRRTITAMLFAPLWMLTQASSLSWRVVRPGSAAGPGLRSRLAGRPAR